MCRNRVCRSRERGHERGFMLPLTLFILVGMAALAVAISRLTGNTQTAAVYETIAAQALNAADSGAQYGMNKILFDAANQAEVDSRCANLNGTSISFTAPGLVGCASSLQCEVRTATSGSRHYYALISAAECGGGQLVAQRRVSVATYFD